MRLDALVSNDPVRALVYGPTGAGKSTLAGLMALHAQFSPMYVADWDLRIASLRRKLPSEVWKNIEVEPYRDVNIQGEAFTKLQAKLERIQGEGFKAFVNDSLTFCTRAVMARVLMLDGNKPPTFTPQLQHYMQSISLTEEFVSRACSKNMAVIMTCHEDTQRDEILGRLYKAVDLQVRVPTGYRVTLMSFGTAKYSKPRRRNHSTVYVPEATWFTLHARPSKASNQSNQRMSSGVKS